MLAREEEKSLEVKEQKLQVRMKTMPLQKRLRRQQSRDIVEGNMQRDKVAVHSFAGLLIVEELDICESK